MLELLQTRERIGVPELARRLEVGERTDYPAGSTVYREGSYPRSFLVVRGLLRVYLTSPEGRQCLSSTNHEGGSDEVHQHDHDQAAPG